MTGPVRIGILADTANVAHVEEVVAEISLAERQGLDSYWLPQVFGFDALTILAVAGASTNRMELGTAVVPTWPRHPTVLGAQALTTQNAAGGRLTLGIGLSHKRLVEDTLGIAFDRPLKHLGEYLDILLPILNGDAARVSGEMMSARYRPRIPETHPVPVMAAALGPKMLELAGQRTAGTITWMTGTETLASHVLPTIRSAAEQAGMPDPRIAVGLPVCVCHPGSDARRRAAETLAVYGDQPSYRAMLDREGLPGPEDLALVGGADELGERIMQFGAAGATDILAFEIGNTEERAATRDMLVGLRAS